MARLNTQRQNELEPARYRKAVVELESLGYKVDIYSPKEINFEFKGALIKFFPYSGWHTGKTIKDGRGLWRMLTQVQ